MPFWTAPQYEDPPPRLRDVVFVVVMAVILIITISQWDDGGSSQSKPPEQTSEEANDPYMVSVGQFRPGSQDQEVPLTTSADTVMGPTQDGCWMEFIYHSTQRTEVATAFAFGRNGCMVQVSYQLESQLCTGFTGWSMPEQSVTAAFYREPIEDEPLSRAEAYTATAHPECDVQGLDAVAFRLGVPASYGTDPMEVKITDGFVLLRTAPS